MSPAQPVAVNVATASVTGGGSTAPPVETDAAALMALLDPGFCAEIGWDADTQILSTPPGHPLVVRPVCRTPGCSTTAPRSDRICTGCRVRLTEHGLSTEQVASLPARVKAPHPADDLGRWPADQECAAASCGRRRRHRDGVYCEAHQQRLRAARKVDTGLDEAHWRATAAEIGRGGQVSLRGLPPLVVAEVLFGLQQRCRIDRVKSTEADLRTLCNQLRAQQVSTIACYEMVLDPDGTFAALVNSVTTHAGRATATPESEVVKDEWDLVVFGHHGTVSFTALSQHWLREAAKRWAADDLPKRRIRAGRRTSGGLAVRHHIGCLARLSESLRVRLDHGEVPTVLDRPAMEAFLNRLAYLESTEQISRDARIRACREVRHVLVAIRTMGLTRPGQLAAGLGPDFTLDVCDIPDDPEPGEAGRDLPTQVMQQLCAHLDRLSSPQMRTGIELAIDTGRRPEEICNLAFDCLARDSDGLPVLVYDNYKADRPERQLPISEETAQVIRAQQQRVRTRYPHTPISELKLLPTDRRNPAGRRAITGFSLAFHHRSWVDRLPALTTADNVEFDKSKVVLYAYRHTFAQRHADAGVGIDVLRELMGHRKLDTTKRYYRVGEDRRREAVDRVAAMQFDRHGNRVWKQAKALLDVEQARRGVGEVVVPFGVCAEPSNVKAGGGACPFRFRCAGCDHFRTDISYLPDLQAHLDDLLRNRERLLATANPEIDEWARAEAMPSEEEIGRIRRLITRIRDGLDDLTADERQHIESAVAVVRRHRTVSLGMPRVRQALPDIRPERPTA